MIVEKDIMSRNDSLTDAESVVKQWNDAAALYTYQQERSVYSALNKELVRERFKKLNGEKVLDLGCGYGYYSIVHPAFYNGEWKDGGNGLMVGKLMYSYITPYVSRNRFWGETTHFHRPISYYLNAAADASLILTHTDEPKIYDGKSKNGDIPLFFFAEYRKPDL